MKIIIISRSVTSELLIVAENYAVRVGAIVKNDQVFNVSISGTAINLICFAHELGKKGIHVGFTEK